MSPSPFTVINLDTDGSIPAQTQLSRALDVIEDLSHQERNLRLWADNLGLAYLRHTVKSLRQHYHAAPWLTFLGSGDFHHYSLALLESLPSDRPVTLVLIDNHPDWFCENPTFHCGNWVSGALALPWVESVILLGQDSGDLKGHHFWNTPWDDLCSGRIQLYPYRRVASFIPAKWPERIEGVQSMQKNPLGTEIRYHTLASVGEERFFDALACRLQGCPIYLSIDKDVLKTDAAATDWEQGCLSLPGLLYGICRLKEHCLIVGADLCGERAPRPLTGFSRRLDAGRLNRKPAFSQDTNALNEKTNLAILNVFVGLPAVAEETLCPV